MSKAVLSNRIYLNCDRGSELDTALSEELTYSISQEPISEFPLIIKNIMRISDSVVSIPAGRSDLIPDGYEIKDKRIVVDAEIPEPKFQLRPAQVEISEGVINSIMAGGVGGLVNAPPGFGKSITALDIAYTLQMKTLIVTTTTTIRDMWVGEIEKWFGFKPGIIGGGKYEVNTPIVVGNIQTVRNRSSDLADKFGCLIVDECHHCSAKTFTEVLNESRASVKIGLSGTLERKDGKHVVFKDYFGNSVLIGKVENVMHPTAHLYDVDFELSSNQFIPWANKVNELKKDPTYRKTILAMAKLYAKMGHKVLIVSDRTEFLQFCNDNLERSCLITGEVKGSDERKAIMDSISNGDKDIICATQSIFSEGVSLNALSCLILATPINNKPLTEQLVGRIQRNEEGKLEPVVVDIRLAGNTGRRHRYTRLGVYMDRGWRTEEFTIDKLVRLASGKNSKKFLDIC